MVGWQNAGNNLILDLMYIFALPLTICFAYLYLKHFDANERKTRRIWLEHASKLEQAIEKDKKKGAKR